MKKSTPSKVEKFAAVKQRRLDHLLAKNSEGTITDKETAKLKQLVAEAEALMVRNARRFASFSQGDKARAPADAVPVTVWGQPQQGER